MSLIEGGLLSVDCAVPLSLCPPSVKAAIPYPATAKRLAHWPANGKGELTSCVVHVIQQAGPMMSEYQMNAARKAMIDSQLRTSGVNEDFVLARMAAVPREAFVPAEANSVAVMDRALALGEGSAEEHTSEIQTPMRTSYAAFR